MDHATQLPGSMNVRHPRISGCCIRSDSSRFYLHFFREGNGRTQRIFWSQIAANAGYELDWRKTSGPINDQASREAMERRDFSGLRAMLGTITSPSSNRGVDDQAARVRLFANLDMPLRGSDLSGPSSSAPRATQGYEQRGRSPDMGRGL
jgi:cell filamentation protein